MMLLLWIVCTVLVFLVDTSNGSPDFAAGSQNYITLSPTVTTAAINITDTTSDSAQTTIYTSTGSESLSKLINSNSITFTTTDFSSKSLDYGIYEVKLELSDDGGSLNTAIIYEIPITGLQVTVAPIVAINEEVTFTATFTQASNVEIEWHWDVLSGDTELDDHVGMVSVITKNHTFSTIAEFNITVIAGNSLGRVYKFVQFKTQYNVNGFSVVSNSGPHGTGEDTVFANFLSSAAQEPMGTITMRLTFGDQGVNNIVLTGAYRADLLSSHGYRINHKYTVQGNYSALVSFESEISTQQFFIDKYIWDNLDNVSLNVPDLGNLSEIVSFKFTDVPASGFNYRVLTGDVQVFENDPSFLYNPYSDPMLTHTYNKIGFYTVNVVIWNPFYSSSYSKVILIQAPIKDMVLTPALTDPSIMYPIPDGIVEFSYSMIVNHPDPTNITCYNSFHPSMQDDIEETNITYGIEINKTFTYTNAGDFTVNITCFNEVSRVELLTKVEMIIAILNKFSLSYPPVTGMNMTIVPSDDGFSDATFTYDEKNVTFQVELLRCVKFPPGIDISFDFGDSTFHESLKNVTVGTTITHTYIKRGNYTVTINVSDQNKGTGSNSCYVKMGATDIIIPDYGGRIAVSEFSFTVSGVGPGATYEVSISSSQTFILTDEPSVKTNIYPNFEKFNPKVIAYNTTFYEITYTEQPVRAEEPMIGVNISLPLKIDLPPGKILVNVSLADGANSLPFINCTFFMGDLIDRKMYHIYKNLTVSNPYLFYFTYITLGNHSATINCSNSISHVDYAVTVNVWNECFQPTGMFDRDYSNETNPLVLYTSQDIDLGSRMAVYCTEQHVTYVWELTTIDDNGTYTIPYAYEPVVPATGIIRFAKGSIEENIYKVTLNVTLDTTWVYEPTYVKFVKPPPFAYIVGGNLLSVKLNKLLVKFDALTSSYDVMYGEGANQNLTFAWTCKRFSTNQLDDLSNKYETAKQNKLLDTYPDCMDKLEQESNDTNGILNMNLTVQEGYAVSVEVFLDNLISNYTQLLQAREGGAPDVGIMCILNCDRKYATTLKSIYQAICHDCEPGEINDLSFLWSLQGINVETSDFKTMALTDINTATISIAADKLLQGREYKLWVSASGGWGRTDDSTQTGRTLLTNSPPYNGHCIASPTEGNATTTSFSIYCSGFLDEGDNFDQDIVRDKNANRALKYKYFAMDKYINPDGTERLERSVLFSGGEMSATELRLSLGSPKLEYTRILQVEISDIYGDYVTEEMPVKVRPDTNLQPKDAKDTTAVGKLFEAFEGTYAITNKGGNKMSVVRIARSTSSMYSHVNVKQTSSPEDSTESPVNIDNNMFVDSSLDTSEDSKIQTMLKQENQRLMDIISGTIPNSKSPAPLLPDDCQLVAKAVEETLSNTDVVTSDTSIAGFAGSNELMQNVYTTTQKHPFQMDQLNSVNRSTSAIMSSLDKNLNYIFVENRENLQEPLTRVTVEAELRTKYDTYYKDRYEIDVGNEEGFQQLVDTVYQQRQFTRKTQEGRIKAASSSTANFYNTLDTAANVSLQIKQYGEQVATLEKDNLHMSFEKNSVQSFLDQGNVSRDGVKISTKNLTISNVSDASMQLTVTVVKKSPVPHAKGDHRISSKCVMISAVDADGKDLKMEREVSLPNPEIVHFLGPTSPDPANPELMLYVRFEVLDNHDASITYIKLKGDVPGDMYIIYTAYFKSEAYPTITEYDYKYDVTTDDMEDMGLKIITPVGTLKQGQCFLALQPKPNVPAADDAAQTRRKRSTVNNNSTSSGNNTFNPFTGNVSIVTITTGCRSFNQTTSAWEPNGCIVLPFSTLNETVCRCPSKTKTLATTFFVTPNTIDFNNVWSKFDIANAAVYGTLTVLLLLYLLLAILLRRKDRQDKLNWSMRFLCDCDSEDPYFYMISVHTGLRPGSGTDSNVNFVLAGEGGDSGVRLLSDGVQHGFGTSSVRNFVMSTNVVLGELTYFRLWHDNTGQGNRNSWYLHKLIVDDPQTNQRYLFQCDKWLSIDFDDGMIERIIPVSITDDIGVESLFYQQSRMNLTENHLWMSLFVRPTRSVFTRVQRLACGMTLLLLTMISNAMFFKSADEETMQADSVKIGFFRLSMSNLFISFIGIIITTPPIFFATFVFRNTEPKAQPLHFQKKTKERKCLPCLKQKESDGEKLKEIESGLSEDDEFLIYKKRRFPYFVAYIAWIVLVLASSASAFFLLLYSMEWGKNKSEEWLSTFILSFFESILFVDPIKVILIAFLIALIFKKHVDDETTLVDMKKLRSAASKHSAGNSRLFWAFRHEILSKAEPPAEEKLNKQREVIKLQTRAKSVFREVILYTVFAIVVYCISYLNRDDRAYIMKSNIDNHIYESSKVQFGFSKVNSMDTLMQWMDETFVPVFYPVQEYNGASLSLQDKFYINDLTNIRLGLVRLRQVRMPKEKCGYWKLTPKHFCTTDFQSSREEKRHHCVSWKSRNSTCPVAEDTFLTKDAYRYRSAEELHSMPFAGGYDVYGGGGYVQDFPNNRDSVNTILNEIKTHRWMDRRTRALLIEFSLYNSNIKLIAFSTFAVEFTDTGNVLAYTFTQSFRPTLLTDATGAVSIFFYFIYIIALIIATVKIIGKFRDQGCDFFKAAWNVIDLITVVLSYAAIAVWIVKYIQTSRALKRYYNDKSGFISFVQIVFWDNVFNSIVGIIVFTATLRILKALGYNKRCAELVTVVKHAAPQLFSFFVVFGLGFFGFVILGHLLFGSSMFDYHNMLTASGSLANTLIGRNSLDKMVAAAPSFAQVYFFVYVLFIIFILLTMFAAILNQSITEVRANYKNESPIGILDLIKGAFTDLLGLVGIHLRSNKRQNSVQKKYMTGVPKKNAQIDTPNLLQLLRDTFGEVGDEKLKNEKNGDKNQSSEGDGISKEDLDYVISEEDKKRFNKLSQKSGCISRARTPRDIDLEISNSKSVENKSYISYL